MSLRAWLTRLFSRRPAAAAVSASDCLREDLERRQRARTLNPISVACRRNGLNNRERKAVFAFFEDIAPRVGLREARQQAVNLAANTGRARKAPAEQLDPWHGPAAA